MKSEDRPKGMSQLDWLWTTYKSYEVQDEPSTLPSDGVILTEKAIHKIVSSSADSISTLEIDDDPYDPSMTNLTGYDPDGEPLTTVNIPKEEHIVSFENREVSQADIDNGCTFIAGTKVLAITTKLGKTYMVSLEDIRNEIKNAAFSLEKGDEENSLIPIYLKDGLGNILSTIQLETENYLSGVEQRLATEDDVSGAASKGITIAEGQAILVLSLINGEKFYIDLSKFVDIYTGTNTDTVNVSVDGYTISADVLLSDDDSNILKHGDDGHLFATTTWAENLTEFSGTPIKFFKGTRENYAESEYTDSIYFSIDTGEILLNGIPYGYYSPNHREIANIEYTKPDTITIEYTNGESDTIELQYAEAGNSLSTSNGGLMTKAHAYKLKGIEDSAQVNVIEKIIFDGTDLEPVDKTVVIDITDIKESINRNKVIAGDASIKIVPGEGSGKNLTSTKVSVQTVPDGGLQTTSEGLRVDESALEKYIGDGKAIVIDEMADSNRQKTISLNINPKSNNLLTATADGAFASVKLKALDLQESDNYIAARYSLVGVDASGNEINTGGATIDILKDKFLKNVELGVIPEGVTGEGNDALVFTFTIADGTDIVRYVDVSTFLREAEAGNGIIIDDNRKYSIKIDTIGSDQNLQGDPYIQVTEDGLKVVGINDSIKASRTEVVSKFTGHVLVSVENQDDGHSKVTITEDDIASAVDLADVTTRTEFLESRADDLEQNFDDLSSTVSRIDLDLSELTTDVQGLHSDMRETQSAVGDLQSDVKSLQTTTENLQGSIETAQKDISDLRTTMTDVQADIANLKSDVSKLQEDLTSLSDSWSWYEGE